MEFQHLASAIVLAIVFGTAGSFFDKKKDKWFDNIYSNENKSEKAYSRAVRAEKFYGRASWIFGSLMWLCLIGAFTIGSSLWGNYF